MHLGAGHTGPGPTLVRPGNARHLLAHQTLPLSPEVERGGGGQSLLLAAVGPWVPAERVHYIFRHCHSHGVERRGSGTAAFILS